MIIRLNVPWRTAVSHLDRSTIQSQSERTIADVSPDGRIVAPFLAHDGKARVVKPVADCMTVGIGVAVAFRKFGNALQYCGLQPMRIRPHDHRL